MSISNSAETEIRPALISFQAAGDEIGRLFVNDKGQLDFTGNLTASAKQFFAMLAPMFNSRKE